MNKLDDSIVHEYSRNILVTKLRDFIVKRDRKMKAKEWRQEKLKQMKDGECFAVLLNNNSAKQLGVEFMFDYPNVKIADLRLMHGGEGLNEQYVLFFNMPEHVLCEADYYGQLRQRFLDAKWKERYHIRADKLTFESFCRSRYDFLFKPCEDEKVLMLVNPSNEDRADGTWSMKGAVENSFIQA